MASGKKSNVVVTREAPRKVDPTRGMSLFVIGPNGVRSFVIPEQGALAIGREDDCEVVIDDDSVSRRHAVIHAGAPPTVEDLRSRNGTRVGGDPLAAGERRPLATGFVVEFGSVVAVVQPGTLSLEAPLAGGKDAKGTKSRGGGDDAAPVVRDGTMKQLYAMIDVIAPSEISVLLLGETGVGKEVFAATVHKRSMRADEAFLKLNCAALAESLLESELFGYEKGAFTGAVGAKPGLFESADGGTVFLDEVGEMPLGTQAKLLRVLESGEVMRVGGLRPKTVDVRIVGATNRDLEEQIAARTFRADLYFRLNGISLTIPPLRKRRAEILPLAESFIARAAAKANREAPRLSDEARAAIEAHEWPGNVRELRNVVERAFVLCGGSPIRAEHLVLQRATARAAESAPEPETSTNAPAVASPARIGALRDDMDVLERKRILDALTRCGGNQSRAARMLGIARGTLIRRIKEYGVVRPQGEGGDEEG